MPSVYPVRGVFWPQDRWGRVRNIAVKRDELDLAWSCLAERAADLALERFGPKLHSVYLSGPAARNRPGGASILVVLRPGMNEHDALTWASAASAELTREAPHQQGVRVTTLRWREVFCTKKRHSPSRFRLAVNAIAIAGRSLTRVIPPAPLSEAVANTAIVSLRTRLAAAKQKTLTSDSRRRMRTISAEVGHAVISAGYATVLAAEQLYTEDLDLRRDVFALHYPELTEKIQQAYDMAAIPGNDPVHVRRFINDAEAWLLPIVDSWLNANNPERQELLSVN